MSLSVLRTVRRGVLAGSLLLGTTLLAAGEAAASAPTFTTIAQLPTAIDSHNESFEFHPAFLPNGQLAVFDTFLNTISVMNADGTDQQPIASLPLNVDGSNLIYDTSLKALAIVADRPTISSTLELFSPSGSLLASLDVSSTVQNVTSLAQGPGGEVLLGSTTGLYGVNVQMSSSSPAVYSLGNSNNIASGPVTGAAATSTDIFVCTTGAMQEYTVSGSFVTNISGNSGCSSPTIDGGSLLDFAGSTTMLFTQNLQSMSMSTFATSTLATLGYQYAPGFTTGSYEDLAVMPSNVVGGTPGGLILSELNTQSIPNSAGRALLPLLYATNASGALGSYKCIAVASTPNDLRYVNVIANPVANTFDFVDQWGGTVTQVSSSGAQATNIIYNYRAPDLLSTDQFGYYPVSAAIDAKKKYLFTLDAMNRVRRFASTGGSGLQGALLATRQVAGSPGSTVPLLATSLAVNNSLVYLGFNNDVYSETETGSAPKRVLAAPQYDTIASMKSGPNGDLLITATGAVPELYVYSSTGKLVKSIKWSFGEPASSDIDSSGHVWIVSSTGDLYESTLTSSRVTKVTTGNFTDVATSSNGTIMLVEPTTVVATTAVQLGL